MKNFEFDYDKEYDVLYIYKSERDVEESIEISEDVVLDLDKEGRVNGIEIFYASEFFNAFNKEIDKEFLSDLKEANFEYQSFRNQWFIVVGLWARGIKIIQPMPPLRKSEYVSPLIASVK